MSSAFPWWADVLAIPFLVIGWVADHVAALTRRAQRAALGSRARTLCDSLGHRFGPRNAEAAGFKRCVRRGGCHGLYPNGHEE